MIDITESEYLRLKQLHRNTHYTKEEAEWLLALTRKHVDIHARVCTSCNSSIAEMKQKIYGWFLNLETEIYNQLYPSQPEIDDLTKAINETKNYTDGNK